MKTLLFITLLTSCSSIYASNSLDFDFLTQTKNKTMYCSDFSKKCYPLISINIKYVNKIHNGLVWKNDFKNGILNILISKEVKSLYKQHEFAILTNRLK